MSLFLADGFRRRKRPFVQIALHRRDEIVDLFLEKVVRAWYDLVAYHDALLRLELIHQRLDGSNWDDAVAVAIDHQARRRAGGEEAEIIEIGRGRYGDKTIDLRAPHQELHRDPGAEGDPGDPAGFRIRVRELEPIERGGGIRKLAWPLIEDALASSDAAEIEAEHREAALNKRIIKAIDNLIVHRAPELRMGMQDDRDRCAGFGVVMITSFDAAGWPIDNHFGHFVNPFLPDLPLVH